MNKKVGRNDPCHCGSGKKSKLCHGQSAATAGQKWLIAIGVVILVSVGYIFYGILTSDDLDNPPPGQVWSPEHGHWHDAPTASPILPQATTGFTSKPPGEPPPGKVWSSEHGHWHDAPVTVNPIIPETSSESTPQPQEEAPPGKVWSPEHDHWHDDPNGITPLAPEPSSISIPK
tara:strand:+ start:882 stop:1403 length:522 start_codon:yes stop_codon:yes gene_type:complete